jgi:hypothetical protein
VNTNESRAARNLFGTALSVEKADDEIRVLAANKAWLTRHLREGLMEMDKLQNLRAANAQQWDIDRSVRRIQRIGREINGKVAELGRRFGKPFKVEDLARPHSMARAKNAKFFEVAAEGVKAAPKAPDKPGAGIDSRGLPVRVPPRGVDPVVAKPAPAVHAGMPPDLAEYDPTPIRGEAPPPPPPPPPPEPPKETKFSGNWGNARAKYQDHRERLDQEGFRRVEVNPVMDDGVGHEKYEHADGRQAEIRIEYDPEADHGSARVIETPAPPPPPPPPPPVPGHLSEEKWAKMGHPMENVRENSRVVDSAYGERPKPVPLNDVDRDKGRMANERFVGDGAIAKIEYHRSENNASGESTYFVDLADGSKAVYKARERSVLERGGRHSLSKDPPESHRELAAYKIDRAMGLKVVPYVGLADLGVEGRRTGSKKPDEAHMMAWCPGKTMGQDRASYSHDLRSSHPDLHRIAALDLITGNTDRHGNNFRKGPKDGRWYAPDNGLAFPKDSDSSQQRGDIGGDLVGSAIHPEVMKEIARLSPDRIRTIMQESNFPDEDIKGAIGRWTALNGKKVWPDSNTFYGEARKAAKKL